VQIEFTFSSVPIVQIADQIPIDFNCNQFFRALKQRSRKYAATGADLHQTVSRLRVYRLDDSGNYRRIV